MCRSVPPNAPLYTVVTKGVFENEDSERYTSYGITVYTSDTHQIVYSVRDLSPDGEAVGRLARLIEEYKVEPAHLEDLIADFCT